MATAVAVASRLVSDAHNNVASENTPSAVHRLQMAIADTECAQALLELAMSIVPAPSSPPLTEPPSDNFPIAPGHSKSLLKREFDAISSLDYIKQEPSDEEETYRLDLVKRIKLDHNYYWTGEDRKTGEVILERDQFKTYCETIKQNGSVPTSSENSQDGDSSPPLMSTPGSYDSSMMSSSSSSEVRYNRQRTVSETTGMAVRHSRQRSVSESQTVSSGWRGGRSERKTSILKTKPDRFVEERYDASSGEEVYEGEEKFHKFQLLMKCLVANEPDEARALDSYDGSRHHRTLSMSSDDTDEGLRSSPDSLRQNQGSHDYQCQVCNKTFLKKRYLTKHAFRMHPWLNGEEETSGATTKNTTTSTPEGLCPHCKQVIKPKKDLQRHVTNCSENYKKAKKQTDLDLVGCQLCGVKMRRQLLVRHLAEEHCVDRLGDYSAAAEQPRSAPYNIPTAAITNVKMEDGSLIDATSSCDTKPTYPTWQHSSEIGATFKHDTLQENSVTPNAAFYKSPSSTM